jgi:hypothetical protein
MQVGNEAVLKTYGATCDPHEKTVEGSGSVGLPGIHSIRPGTPETLLIVANDSDADADAHYKSHDRAYYTLV